MLEYFFYGKLGRDECKKLPFGKERVAVAFSIPANLLTLGMIIAVGFMYPFTRRYLHYNYADYALLRWEIAMGYGAILAVLWVILYRHLKSKKTSEGESS